MSTIECLPTCARMQYDNEPKLQGDHSAKQHIKCIRSTVHDIDLSDDTNGSVTLTKKESAMKKSERGRY